MTLGYSGKGCRKELAIEFVLDYARSDWRTFVYGLTIYYIYNGQQAEKLFLENSLTISVERIILLLPFGGAKVLEMNSRRWLVVFTIIIGILAITSISLVLVTKGNQVALLSEDSPQGIVQRYLLSLIHI